MKQTLYFILFLLCIGAYPMVGAAETTAPKSAEELQASKPAVLKKEARVRPEDKSLLPQRERVRALLLHLLRGGKHPHTH